MKKVKGRWGAGVFAISLLAMISVAPLTASAAPVHRIPPPGLRDYQVAITATWNIPKGSRVSFQPVNFNCTDGPVFAGSFTTDSDPFANVIPLMIADQGFACLFQLTRGVWRISVTRPGKAPTEVTFVDTQVGPLTYLPGCTTGLPSCVGTPRPLVPLSSVVFSY